MKSRNITYHELLNLGLDENQLIEALENLVNYHYIYWDKDDSKCVAINKKVTPLHGIYTI